MLESQGSKKKTNKPKNETQPPPKQLINLMGIGLLTAFFFFVVSMYLPDSGLPKEHM